MSPALRGRILLAKSQSHAPCEDRIISFIASINQELENLIKPDESNHGRQHLLVAQAIATTFIRDTEQISITPQATFCGAIVLGDSTLVQALLEKLRPDAIDVNSEEPLFGLPLHLAATWGHVARVDYLLARGADPRALSSQCHEEGIKEFDHQTHLFAGRSHLCRSPEGSALRSAALAGNVEIVRILLKPGNRLSTTQVEYYNVLLASVRTGRLDLLQLLLDTAGKQISELPNNLVDLMFWDACFHDQEDVSRHLLDSGLDVNTAIYQKGRFSCGLSIAAAEGNIRMVRFLIDRRANVNAEYTPRSQPVACAASNGYEDVVDLLLRHGADAAHALYAAAYGGQARMVRWLLNKKPALVSEPEASYALIQGIWLRNPSIITSLVNSGVSVNEPIDDDKYPIMLAKEYGGSWTVDVLLALGAEDRDIPSCAQEAEEMAGEDTKLGVCITKWTWEWVGRY